MTHYHCRLSRRTLALLGMLGDERAEYMADLIRWHGRPVYAAELTMGGAS